MPRFKVLMKRYVEEIAEIEVEATTPEAARDEILRLEAVGELDMEYDVEWQDGSDVEDFAVYAVKTTNDELVWELSNTAST